MRGKVEGNLLHAEGVIGHQTNCLGIMGGGIALQVRKMFPIVYEKYKALCSSYNSHSLLGLIQPIKVNDKLSVYNLFGQHSIGRTKCHTDYDALRKIALKLIDKNVTIHLPYKMGCVLGGGDWDIVQDIFKDVKGNWYIYKEYSPPYIYSTKE